MLFLLTISRSLEVNILARHVNDDALTGLYWTGCHRGLEGQKQNQPGHTGLKV